MLSATVLHVNTTADIVDGSDAFLSLREAVLAANASPGNEEIHLPSGHYLLTRQGSNEDVALAGDLDILDSGSLTILGAGRDTTTIDAAPLEIEELEDGDRIFHVREAAFEMRGLTLTGATRSALWNDGGQVSIFASAFVDNHVPNGGGAISNSSYPSPPYVARMSIDGTSFLANSGSTGGISSSVDLIVTNSHFEANQGGFNGGAMLLSGQYTDRIRSEVRNSTFVENEATYGGAIQVMSFFNVSISNNQFERNRAEAGGAVAIFQGNAVIEDSSFLENSVLGDGGAILSVLGSEAFVSRSLIAGNTATRGGGIWGRAHVLNSTISYNVARKDGGGIADMAAIYNSTIVGNLADSDGDGAGIGGGLFGIWSIHNSIVIGNTRGAVNASLSSDIEAPFLTLTTSGYNVIGIVTSPVGLIHGKNGNIIGNSSSPLDINAVLDPILADHGGLTLSHALSLNSPARNAADPNFDLATVADSFASWFWRHRPTPSARFDQRGPGYLRINGGRSDIGAIESDSSFAAAVDNRRVFYNNSMFDGPETDNPLVNLLATDYTKSALLPDGVLAEAWNVTSYSRGLYGIMLDVASLSSNLTEDDFLFRLGANNNPATWAAAPAPLELKILTGQGAGGSDRVVITWPDGAIKNTYLQVVILKNENTGLAEPDVFFFGNRIGESFNTRPMGAFTTTSIDELAARNGAPQAGLDVADLFDYDKSGTLTAADQLIARANVGLLRRIQIAPPVAASGLISGEGALTANASTLLLNVSASTAALPSAPSVPLERTSQAKLPSELVDQLMATPELPTTQLLSNTASDETTAADFVALEDLLPPLARPI